MNEQGRGHTALPASRPGGGCLPTPYSGMTTSSASLLPSTRLSLLLELQASRSPLPISMALGWETLAKSFLLHWWSVGQQHHHLLGACEQCRHASPTPDLLHQKRLLNKARVTCVHIKAGEALRVVFNPGGILESPGSN